MEFLQRRRTLVVLSAIALSLTLLLGFVIPKALKWSLEYSGSHVAGAEVNIKDLSLSYIPLAIELVDVEVTDARQLEHNLVQFSQASAAVEWLPLFFGRTVVDNITVTDVQLDQPRAKPGKLYSIVKSTAIGEDGEQGKTPNVLDLLTDQLPSVDDILAKEQLATRLAQQQLVANYEANQQRIKEANQQLPDQETIRRYEAEIREITDGSVENIEDLQRRRQQLEALKKDIRQDRAQIQTLLTAVDDSTSMLKSDLKSLRQAPRQDIEYLSEKYTFDTAGGLNLTALILGERARYWSETALYWYTKLAPYIDSSAEEKGKDSNANIADNQNADLSEEATDPNLLIRRALISIMTGSGYIRIKGQDITDQPRLLQRPTLFVLSGDGIDHIRSINGELRLNERQLSVNNADVFSSVLDLDIKGWKIPLTDTFLDGIQWQADATDLDLVATVTQGQLASDANADISQSQFLQVNGASAQTDIFNALSDLDQFKLVASARGPALTPEVTLKSDLDRALKRVVKRRVRAKTKEFKNQLDDALQNEIRQVVSNYDGKLALLDDQQDQLTDQSNLLNDLLGQGLADFKQQKKNELLKSAKDKLRSFF